MSRLFEADSFVMTGLFKFADLLIINVLFIICCIPIITIGAATTALYYSCMRLVDDRGTSVVKGFFHSFTQNFKQGTGMWIIYVLASAFVGVDFYLLTKYDVSINKILLAMLIIPTALIIFSFVYAFPLLSRFENTTRTTLVNSVLLSLSSLPLTAIMIVFDVLPILLIVLMPKLAPITILLGFSSVAYSNSIFLLKLFQKLQPEDEEESDEIEKNNAENMQE